MTNYQTFVALHYKAEHKVPTEKTLNNNHRLTISIRRHYRAAKNNIHVHVGACVFYICMAKSM